MTSLYLNIQTALEHQQFFKVLNIDNLAKSNITTTQELKKLIERHILNLSIQDKPQIIDLINHYSSDLLIAILRQRRLSNFEL